MEEALALFRAIDDQGRVAWSLFTLGLLNAKQGEYTRACALFEDSVTLFKQLGHKRGMAATLTQWAGTLFVSQAEPRLFDPLLQEGVSLRGRGTRKELLFVAPPGLGSAHQSTRRCLYPCRGGLTLTRRWSIARV
jgi:hypothetical protein